MNLVLLDAQELSPAGEVVLHDDRATHLRTVLRVAPGHSVRVGLVEGPLGRAVVQGMGPDDVRLVCEFESVVPPRPAVDLLLALPRPKVLRRLWAQLAALGVGRIMITNAERVERNYFDTHVLTPAVYRPLLLEGLQQARDTRVPMVSVHRRLKVLIEDELDALSDAAIRLLADPGAGSPWNAATLGRPSDRVLLAVGPEGGWNEFERRALTAAGFLRVSLGERTLRTDTACLALLSVVHATRAAALTP